MRITSVSSPEALKMDRTTHHSRERSRKSSQIPEVKIQIDASSRTSSTQNRAASSDGTLTENMTETPWSREPKPKIFHQKPPRKGSLFNFHRLFNQSYQVDYLPPLGSLILSMYLFSFNIQFLFSPFCFACCICLRGWFGVCVVTPQYIRSTRS